MSYLIGEDMHHGPPGPLDVAPSLGDACTMCRKVGMGDFAGVSTPVLALGALGAYLLLRKKRR